MTGALALAQVMAHCGGSPAAATSFIAQAVAADPRDPEPYSALEHLRRELPAEVTAVVAAPNTTGPMLARAYLSFVDGDMDEAAMSLGAVTGYQPDVPWASAPCHDGLGAPKVDLRLPKVTNSRSRESDRAR